MDPSSFPELLRQHRLTRGLTQEELAERAGLSARAVSDLERGLKQSPRASTVRLLVRGLGLSDADALTLRRAAQDAPARPDRLDLPVQLTSFVGRARELTEIATRLVEHRLVSLTGAGGVGKTRLAFEAATRGRAAYPDGVWAVELAPLPDPAQVPREFAARLGLEVRGNQAPHDVLQAGLAHRELLVILDNCEHVVEACADLASFLLRTCPGVRLIATSRERLAVPGEAVYVVGPLAAPSVRDTAHPTELARYDAVALFVERARLARGDFVLTEQNAAAVTAICRDLDGIPLAIELAAARTRALPPDDIATRLAAWPFRLLTGGRAVPERQQTLAAALDWSYQLLSEGERRLLRGLSAFVGGFALEAAEAVFGGESILDELTGLVDKSLVVVAERRYRLLEPIRQYAARKLFEGGEADAVRARHRDWCLAFAERAVEGMIAPDQVTWFQRLDAEHDNLRAALEFSRVEGDAESELRLVGALAAFWARRAVYEAEGRARIDDVLPRTEHVSSLAGRRARVLALDWRGFLDKGHETTCAERAVALARELGDARLLAMALRHLATNDFQAYGPGPNPPEQAQALLQEAIACARTVGLNREVGYSLARLARMAHARSDISEAEQLSTEALVVLRQVGDRDALKFGLGVSARIALERGERERARKQLEEAAALQTELVGHPLVSDATLLATLDAQNGDFEAAYTRFGDILRAAGDPALLVFALVGVAQVAAAYGDALAAVRLYGAALAHPAFKRHSDLPTAVDAMHAATGLCSVLGGEAFVAAWAEGEQMRFDEVVAYALALEAPAAGSGLEVTDQPMSPSENVPSYEDLIAIASVFPVGLPAIVEEVKQVHLPFDEHVRQIRLAYGEDIDADRFARMVRVAVAEVNRS